MLRSKLFNFCQLRYIDCICAIFPTSYVCNLITAHRNRIAINHYILRIISCTISNLQTFIIDFDIVNCNGAVVSKIDILIQLNQQLSIFTILAGYNADIAINQVFFVCRISFDIDLLIQFNFRYITEVTTKLQTVVQRCYLMSIINDASNTVRTIDTGITFFCAHSQRRAIFTIGTFRAYQADRSIFAVNNNRCAIFAIDSNLTVNAVLTICTSLANIQVIAQFQVICNLTVIYFLGQLEIAIGRRCILAVLVIIGNGIFRSLFATVDSDKGVLARNRIYNRFQLFQLSHVDRIGIFRTSSYVSNLTGRTCKSAITAFRSITHRNSSFCCSPCDICRLMSCSRRVIPSSCRNPHIGNRLCTDGHAIIYRCVGIMADDDCIGSFGWRIFRFGRADDDIVAPIFQRMVIPEDNIGLVVFYRVTRYGVMGANQVVVLSVG